MEELWKAFEYFVNYIYYENTFDDLIKHFNVRTLMDIFDQYSAKEFIKKMDEFKEYLEGKNE